MVGVNKSRDRSRKQNANDLQPTSQQRDQRELRVDQKHRMASRIQGQHQVPHGDPAAHLLFRTKLCKFFSMGVCARGPHCAFAHDTAVLRSTPNLSKTSLCPQLMKYGRCDKGDNCNYAHSKSELRSVSQNKPITTVEKSATISQRKPNNVVISSVPPDDDSVPTVDSTGMGPLRPTEVSDATLAPSVGAKEKPAKVSTQKDENSASFPYLRSPLRAPFSSPKRIPEIVLTSPHFCPTSPPWRPLSPPFGDSFSVEDGRTRFDSQGCIVVKNTFLEVVPDEDDAVEKHPMIRRNSTGGEPETYGDLTLTSFASTTTSSLPSEEDYDCRAQSSAPDREESGHPSSRARSGKTEGRWSIEKKCLPGHGESEKCSGNGEAVEAQQHVNGLVAVARQW